jgi:hypothetical protein
VQLLLHIHIHDYVFHASRYKEARNSDTARDGVVVGMVESVCVCVVVLMDRGRGSRGARCGGWSLSLCTVS